MEQTRTLALVELVELSLILPPKLTLLGARMVKEEWGKRNETYHFLDIALTYPRPRRGLADLMFAGMRWREYGSIAKANHFVQQYGDAWGRRFLEIPVEDEDEEGH